MHSPQRRCCSKRAAHMWYLCGLSSRLTGCSRGKLSVQRPARLPSNDGLSGPTRSLQQTSPDRIALSDRKQSERRISRYWNMLSQSLQLESRTQWKLCIFREASRHRFSKWKTFRYALKNWFSDLTIRFNIELINTFPCIFCYYFFWSEDQLSDIPPNMFGKEPNIYFSSIIFISAVVFMN
jgi:hypothetical protein